MSTPAISVVMGTYNGCAFVREQLESILVQTLAPAEILVSDDGSTDGTLDVVADVAKSSRIPIHVHSNPVRLGFADNFLTASSRALGTHIAFSDQDDRWRPDKLEAGYAALEQYDAVLSSHRVATMDVEGSVNASSSETAATTVIDPARADPWGNFYGFTMLFERSLLDRVPASKRGSDPHEMGALLSHDRWVWFLASTWGRMVQLGDELADYRQHPGQLYGGQRPRGAIERLVTKRREGHRQTRYLAEIAAHRASLLGDAGCEPEIADRWARRAGLLVDSAELYGDIGLGSRASAVVRGLRRGAYQPISRGGLGARRLRHDLVMAATPRSVGKSDTARR